MDPETGVVRSPYTPGIYKDTSETLTDYLLTHLREGVKTWGDKPFIVDVTAGTSVKFCELEDQSRRVASALSRRGFKQNDVLYFVTYEMAQLYVIQLAVWRLGGAVRGCFQGEAPEEYIRQISQTRSSFVLIDETTAPVLREAISELDWFVKLFSVGKVTPEGATPFTELVQDDGTAMPDEIYYIDPAECVVTIPNTSGSTGVPKGVLHTHNTAKALIQCIKPHFPATSLLESMITYGIGTYAYGLHAICSGMTIYHIGKFQKENYFDIILKHKPRHVLIYPYVASWFARCSSDLKRIREADFLETIWIGGWVLDHTTAELLEHELPQTDIRQMFGMTELGFFSLSDAAVRSKRVKLISVENEGQVSVSSGKLLPYGEAKIIDVSSGETLPPLGIGELLVRTPCLMRGYLVPGKDPNRSDIDEDGWFHSGDIAFFDKFGNIYIRERLTFMFKYFMNYVSPCELESVLQSHPAVSSAGVVGVPNPESDSLARALVVLRPESKASSDELREFVAQRLPSFKHLHGGVIFVDSLPVGRAGKLDRKALRELALCG